ncbi:hypothetical protein B0H11DRAFT_2287925 [Mycena galericulata]|nr:hypothetical protein B0H11DRAFT_2287925 [Mycena galericulata]
MPVLAPTIPDGQATSSSSSDAQAHPRPPKAPPLTSMPSTPGPVVPGGYPRNSVVFAGNQWDRSQRSGNESSGTGTGTGTGLLASAKTYLPPAVTSYFPDVPAASSSSSPTTTTTTTNPHTSWNPTATAHAGHTPYPHTPPHLLNTDGSTASAASDFSTRAAYAASEASRGTATPVPSTYTYTAPQQRQEEGELRPRATSGLMPSHPGVGSARTGVSAATPISPSASSGSGSGTSSAVTTPSTAPSSPGPAVSFSPQSPASASNAPKTKTKTSPFVRFASLRRGKGAEKKEGAGPSSFAGHARGGSLDSSPVSVSAPSALKSPTQAQAQAEAQGNAANTTATAKPPMRKPSLLRTLRGEAKVLAGRVRRDPGRVEKGRRMIDGEA